MMRLLNPYYIILSFVLLCFSACGDDSSTTSVPNGVDGQVSTIDDLLNCTANLEGETYFVTEQKSTYICVDNKWMDFAPTMDDLLNCTVNLEGETYFVSEQNSAYVCSNGKWKQPSSLSPSKNNSSSSTYPFSSVIWFSSSSKPQSSSVAQSSSSFDQFNPNVEYGELIDTRDGQAYKTVIIGTQIWMAENLNFKTDSSICYENDERNCSKYGRLYTWADAMDSTGLFSTGGKGCGYGKECSPRFPVRGVCPSGWHLPNKIELKTLIAAADGNLNFGKVLKSRFGWNEFRGIVSMDDFGFAALPAGMWSSLRGDFDYIGYSGYFWSSNHSDRWSTYVLSLDSDKDYQQTKEFTKASFLSVRCLNDDASEQITSYNSGVSYFNPNVEYGELVDSRDGKSYKTVTIGSQTWMAENLNYETTASYCYADVAASCTKYGRLYTRAAAMDSAGRWSTNGKGCGNDETCSPTYPVRGVCPDGWHLPSEDEWSVLFTTVGDSSVVGNKLKATSGWYWNRGSDDFGFSALPAGSRDDGNYGNEGFWAFFWSSTKDNIIGKFSQCLLMKYEDSIAFMTTCGGSGISVRCLKD